MLSIVLLMHHHVRDFNSCNFSQTSVHFLVATFGGHLLPCGGPHLLTLTAFISSNSVVLYKLLPLLIQICFLYCTFLWLEVEKFVTIWSSSQQSLRGIRILTIKNLVL